MIKAENGMVEIKGNPEEILTDFTLLLNHTREVLTHHLSEETANDLLSAAWEISKMDLKKIDFGAAKVAKS